jgi:thiamine biosynthesis lipoprotein
MWTSLLIAVTLTTTAQAPTAAPQTQAFRLTAEVFAQPAVLEVYGPTRGEAHAALSAALDEMRTIERLTDPDGTEPGGLGALNRVQGGPPVALDPRLTELLQRALYFCEWSEGAYGPLGGHLNQLWHGAQSMELPAAGANGLAPAIAASRCDHLRLSNDLGSASLAEGARADLFGFARGFAIDRAIAVLQAAGIIDGMVVLGSGARAIGPGTDGRGWPVPLSATATYGTASGQIWLLDRSLAVAARDDLESVPEGSDAAATATNPRTAGDTPAPYIHHRRGEPTQGVLAVLVSTELAADSQGLASCLFVTGSRQGQLYLGNLRPSPAVRWLMGRGVGRPLVIDYHWSDITH